MLWNINKTKTTSNNISPLNNANPLGNSRENTPSVPISFNPLGKYYQA
jgi:hypothetical protein